METISKTQGGLLAIGTRNFLLSMSLGSSIANLYMPKVLKALLEDEASCRIFKEVGHQNIIAEMEELARTNKERDNFSTCSSLVSPIYVGLFLC